MLKKRERGFSLVELVIVVVILGIIAAIAIPRISSGSRNAGESALRANLATIRNAIDWYYGEHGSVYPGVNDAAGSFGAAGSSDAFTNQLINYTKSNGEVSSSLNTAYPYGPYIRGSSFPALPVGSNATKNTVKIVSKAGLLDGTDTDASAGWVFNSQTGQIMANLPDTETSGDGTVFNTF